MKTKTIFVVVGECGDYDGERHWQVCAFKTEKRAQTFAKDCQRLADEIWMASNYKDGDLHDVYMKLGFHRNFGEGLHKLDKYYANDISTNTRYNVIALEYCDE